MASLKSGSMDVDAHRSSRKEDKGVALYDHRFNLDVVYGVSLLV